MYKTVSTSMLRVGAVLSSPLYDQENNRLLAAGIAVGEKLLDQLHRRGIGTIVVDAEDLTRLAAYQPQGTLKTAMPDRDGVHCELETEISRRIDGIVDRGAGLQIVQQGNPFSAMMQYPSQTYDQEAMEFIVELHQRSLDTLDQSFNALVAGGGLDTNEMMTITEEVLMSAADDLDLFVCLGINPASGTYPTRHSLHVAMVAMAMGSTLGLDRETLMVLGIGCLIHDIGMLRIRSDAYQSSKVLDSGDFLEITKHPLMTFDLLQEHVDKVPSGARMVAYQMHERCDGSGYPRGRTGDRIHDLAKIAGVADSYIALVSPRPHRAGMLPYYAVEKLLHDVRDGKFEGKVVRALLQTISLFPVGSYVALNDGRMGKVIRTCGAAYDRPLVEVWNRGEVHGPGTLVNLADKPELRVIRPLARLR